MHELIFIFVCAGVLNSEQSDVIGAIFMNDEIVVVDALDALDFIRIVVDERRFFFTVARIYQQIGFLELNYRFKMLESNILLHNEHTVDSAFLLLGVEFLTYLICFQILLLLQVTSIDSRNLMLQVVSVSLISSMEVLLHSDRVNDLLSPRVDEDVEVSVVGEIDPLDSADIIRIIRQIMVHHVLWVSQRADHNAHFSKRIRKEGPPERCELATISTSIVLLALTVVQDLPAHELFAVADCCDAEYLLIIAYSRVVSLKLDGFLHFYRATAKNFGVAEIFSLL